MRFAIFIASASILLISSNFYPALGMAERHSNPGALSGAMYTFHSGRQSGELLPEGICVSCHPGPLSQAMRGTLAAMGVTCSDCHGGMSVMETGQELGGMKSLTCESCHRVDADLAFTMLPEKPTQVLAGTISIAACEACHTHHQQESSWHFETQE